MRTGRGARRGPRVATAVGVAALAGALGAGSASAASNLSVTRSDGTDAAASPTTSHTCLTVVGNVPASLTPATTTMTVVDPGGVSHAAGSVGASPTGARQITFRFSTQTLSWGDSCGSGGPVAPNGTYTARLSGGVTSSLAVDVAVPPPAPSGLTGSPDRTVADFSWQRNVEESDFVGYEIDDSTGRSVTGVLRPADVCASATCAVTVDFGASAAGTSMSFVARAVRGDGSGGQLRSDPSSAVTVTFPAASSPSTGAGAGSDARSPTGSGPAGQGSRAAGRQGPGLPGTHPAAELRAYLPTVSAGQAPNLPSVLTQVAPLPEGTYQPRLAYPDQPARPGTRPSASAGVAGEVAQVFSAKPLWRGLAGAAVLFLLAAHLRAWIARLDAADYP